MNLTGHNRRLRIKSTVGKGDSTNRIFPRPPGIWIMGAGSGNAAAPETHDGEGRGGFLLLQSCRGEKRAGIPNYCYVIAEGPPFYESKGGPRSF